MFFHFSVFPHRTAIKMFWIWEELKFFMDKNLERYHKVYKGWKKFKFSYWLDQYVEKAMATPSSTLVWKIPWTEGPGSAVHWVAKSRTRLSDFPFTFHFHALEKEMATHSSVLAWRTSGTGEPGGLLSMGSHRVRHAWSDLVAVADQYEINLG